MLMNFHTHSNTSEDSSLTISQIRDCAKENGIKYVCITNHHEPGEILSGLTRQSMTEKELDDYEKELKNLKTEDTEMFFGIEMSYYEDQEKYTQEFLRKKSFDFVIGSVHKVLGYNIANPKTRYRIPVQIHDSARTEYFRLLKKAIKSKMFDVIGHIDIFERSLPKVPFEELKKEWTEVAKLLIENDIGIEINTSPTKTSPEGRFESHPSKEVAELLINAGVKKITIGSDAHSIKHFATGIKEAEELLKSIGVEMVCIFRKRIPEFIEL